jgi:hypothetical protein
MTPSFRPQWGLLSLWQKWVPGIFIGGKRGRCVGLKILKSESLNFLQHWGLAQRLLRFVSDLLRLLSWNLRACPGLYRDCFTLHQYQLSEPRQSGCYGCQRVRAFSQDRKFWVLGLQQILKTVRSSYSQATVHCRMHTPVRSTRVMLPTQSLLTCPLGATFDTLHREGLGCDSR